MQHSSGSGQSAAAGSILPTQQQLHEIYEENLRLREEVVKTSTAGGGGPASAEAAAARNQVCHIFLIYVTISRDVTTGATGATAVAPKFSGYLTLSQPRGADSAHHYRGSS